MILLYALVEVSLVRAAPDAALVYATLVEVSLVPDAVPVDAALVDAVLVYYVAPVDASLVDAAFAAAFSVLLGISSFLYCCLQSEVKMRRMPP